KLLKYSDWTYKSRIMNYNGFDVGGLFDVELALENLPLILKGLPITLSIAIVRMTIVLFLELFLALLRDSNRWILQWPARIYISFMRGTPMLVFLFIIYFGLPVIGIEFNALTAAFLAFDLNSAAYIAEINRSALNS